MLELQKAQKAKMSKVKLQKVQCVPQMCNDRLHAATATATPTANLDNSEACVKRTKHIFEDKNGNFGGIKGLTDNDDFDLWTSLRSINEFQNYGSLSESVKNIIHKNKDVFCSKLTAARHIKTDPVKISIRGGQCQKPKPCYRARPIPVHWYAKGKSILADLEEQGSIVCVTKASEYCSPCFFSDPDILSHMIRPNHVWWWIIH